ncbi:N-6 DNA methylase [Amycolatopsis sp. NPDC051071]|uniref:N-6 DNA methylase n=1 Tax=Amycolatopsis sp. NPDC051071 TaxID=3154637 RepID=UPI003420CB9B
MPFLRNESTRLCATHHSASASGVTTHSPTTCSGSTACRPRSESELAWVQHCLAHLHADDTAVVVMSSGAAERSGGRRICAELVRTGVLRAVIALPHGAAPPLHVSLQL